MPYGSLFVANEETDSPGALRRAQRGLATILRTPEPRQRHFFRVAMLGLLAGLMAVAFQISLYAVENLRGVALKRLHLHPAWGWAILPLFGFVAGSAAGLLVAKVEPDAAGSGIPHVKGVLLHVRAMRWVRVIFVKFLGGVLGIGAGLSLGREGPTVQLSAAIGEGMGKLLNLRPRVTNQLVSCGAGAGLAAAFNAPLAGFIFVIEELRREMSPVTYTGALIAAVCADIVARMLTGQLPSFHITSPPPMELTALPAFAMLGILCGAVGVLWNKALLAGVARLRGTRRVPVWVITGLVASLCGLVAWWFPDAVGGGHAVAERILRGDKAVTATQLLLVILGLKFALTVLSFSSNAPGGIFAPMLLMGELSGMTFGRLAGSIAPSLGLDERAFAVLGMAGWFTASVRAPLTGMVLILEMTGGHEHLFAIAVVCLCAYLIADQLDPRPIYEALLEQDLRRRGVGEAKEEPVPVTIGIQHGSQLEGATLKAAKFPPGCLVTAIERRGHEIVPSGDAVLMPGDHITVLTPGDKPEYALNVVEMARGGWGNRNDPPAPTS